MLTVMFQNGQTVRVQRKSIYQKVKICTKHLPARKSFLRENLNGAGRG